MSRSVVRKTTTKRDMGIRMGMGMGIGIGIRIRIGIGIGRRHGGGVCGKIEEIEAAIFRLRQVHNHNSSLNAKYSS